MEWVGLITWLLVLGLALPVAGAGGFASPSLAVHSLFAVAGFAACVLYIAVDWGTWVAWVSCGLAVVATGAVLAGAARLNADDRSASNVGQGGEEVAALLAGVELPLLGAVAFAMMLAAVGVTNV